MCVCVYATDLAGADLPVDVGLLADAVLQVRDVGLQPVPVADDGGSLHRVAALRTLPSERESRALFKHNILVRTLFNNSWKLLKIVKISCFS